MREMWLEQGMRGSADILGSAGFNFIVIMASLIGIVWGIVEIITFIVEFVKKKCRKKEEKP